jgi:hypothetical protein
MDRKVDVLDKFVSGYNCTLYGNGPVALWRQTRVANEREDGVTARETEEERRYRLPCRADGAHHQREE